LVAVAWMAIRYWVGEGVGVGSVVTAMSNGPWGLVIGWADGVGKERHLEVFLHLDGAHDG
jgi:hypothetical protein